MNPRWTFLAACPFALAIAMVAYQHITPAVTGATSELPAGTAATADSSARVAAAHSGPRTQAVATRESRSHDEPALDGHTRSLTRNAAAGSHPDSPSRAELENRAQWVERESNRELARLIPLLDLVPEQQQRVFQALARTSQHFVPGMLVDGATVQPSTATSQQTLLAELSDAQITAYLEDSNERSAWWSEYITGITSQLDSGTPAVGGATTIVATTPPADTTPPAATPPATKDARAITEGE